MTTQPAYFNVFTKRLLIGAAIGLVLISAFLIMAGPGKPEWGSWWRIRPLVMVPVAGAAGAFFYHLMDRFRSQGGWKRVAVNILCLLVFVVGLWLGTVLGLDGTLWN